ncbi:MAG: hypothetical protein M3R53_10540 [Candidatus Eremiobacteraeota bacterium]|nr:hypothetical protein [Candidatus Eremiobacteraeota bacterium]
MSAIATDPVDEGSIEELFREIEGLDLQDIDPEALREAEFAQIQWILDELTGKTIEKAVIENNRIVIETCDGNRYFFYGFMGSGPQT